MTVEHYFRKLFSHREPELFDGVNGFLATHNANGQNYAFERLKKKTKDFSAETICSLYTK